MEEDIIEANELIVEKGEKPKKKYKAGGVTLSVFERESDGKKWDVYVFQRTYLDKKTGEWKHTNSLNEKDLPKALAVLLRAFSDKVEVE
ncbi:MAG: hypothetical protein J7K68_05865 [Candidatus Diapherotrites archaeon]|nr:hypothetical protein [Candidatus Diapherotrites archaeon]